MKARQRIRMIADKDHFHELYSDMRAGNPLNFPGYTDKIETVRAASGEKEAVLCGTAEIGGQSCCVFVMESYFMMGSMGSAVGEKITSLFEYANGTPPTGDWVYCVRWCSHAGGAALSDADGKDKCCCQTTQ